MFRASWQYDNLENNGKFASVVDAYHNLFKIKHDRLGLGESSMVSFETIFDKANRLDLLVYENGMLNLDHLQCVPIFAAAHDCDSRCAIVRDVAEFEETEAFGGIMTTPSGYVASIVGIHEQHYVILKEHVAPLHEIMEELFGPITAVYLLDCEND